MSVYSSIDHNIAILSNCDPHYTNGNRNVIIYIISNCSTQFCIGISFCKGEVFMTMKSKNCVHFHINYRKILQLINIFKHSLNYLNIWCYILSGFGNHTHKLIAYVKEKNHEIYFIQHFSMREAATFFLPNSEGVKLHNSFNTHEGTIITKHYPNSFRETSLQEKL